MARVHAPAQLNLDTFDALQSGEPTVREVLGRTHSRLLDWIDPASATIGPGLATSWEQPEETRVLLRLDKAARWHERAPLNGSRVEAEQVSSHLRRAVELARAGRMPAIQRPQDWLRVSDIATVGDAVRIETDGRDPFILQTLASRFALVQAPEAVAAFEDSWHELDPAAVVGSGPFNYEGSHEGALRFRAQSTGHGSPLLDGLELFEPVDLVTRFREQRLDEALFRDRRDAPAAAAGNEADVTALSRFEDSPIITTLSVGAPPWNNVSLRRALSAALNRGELSRRLFAGRAAASGPVSPAHQAFAYTEDELARFPGYRGDYSADIAEARRLWDAGGGPALGALTVDIPAIFDPLYGASSVLVGMLREALGIEVKVRVDSYIAISGRVASGAYGNGSLALWFGWGPPDVEPDPSRSLIETYDSTAPSAAALGYGSEVVDLAIRDIRAAWELNERKDGVKRLQSHILDDAGGPVLTWLLQRSDVLRWNYYRGPDPSPFWNQHRAAAVELQPDHPAFAGRA